MRIIHLMFRPCLEFQAVHVNTITIFYTRKMVIGRKALITWEVLIELFQWGCYSKKKKKAAFVTANMSLEMYSIIYLADHIHNRFLSSYCVDINFASLRSVNLYFHGRITGNFVYTLTFGPFRFFHLVEESLANPKLNIFDKVAAFAQ